MKYDKLKDSMGLVQKNVMWRYWSISYFLKELPVYCILLNYT